MNTLYILYGQLRHLFGRHRCWRGQACIPFCWNCEAVGKWDGTREGRLKKEVAYRDTPNFVLVVPPRSYLKQS